MENDPNRELPPPAEQVRLEKPVGKPVFRMLAFIVCLAVLVAAFAVSGLWSSRGDITETALGGLFHRRRVSETESNSTDDRERSDEPTTTEASPREDLQPDAPKTRPDGAISVLAQTIPEADHPVFDGEPSEWRTELDGEGPAVLVIVTRPSEAYLPESAEWIEGDPGDLIWSEDTDHGVSRVGETFCRVLNENGISAFLCADEEPSESVLGSGARAAELIAKMLELYPGVRYVVDIGRDVVTDEAGNYLRTLTDGTTDPTAQILAVVGSDQSGLPCPAWHENLAFACAFGDLMNHTVPTSFRGIVLRDTPCNQQIAPRSLSLKVGSGANTAEEAERAAALAGRVLAQLLLTS